MENKFDMYKKQILKNMFLCKFFGPKKVIMKYYLQMHGNDYGYDFNNPKTFTEKLNTRKLSSNQLFKQCADKVLVRNYVKDKIGEEYLIPQYFVVHKLIGKVFDKMPKSCVLKTASGSGTLEIIYDKDKVNKKEILKKMKAYQKVKFHYIWGEFFYKGIKNRIICEKLLLTQEGKVPMDIKVHCFKNARGGGSIFYSIRY